MARMNDVGGMEGFPPVEQEADEPAFHADWEAHVFALNSALIGRGLYNLDEFRDAIEQLPPAEYLASSYYEKWFRAITALLARKGIVTEEELAGGGALQPGAPAPGRGGGGPAGNRGAPPRPRAPRRGGLPAEPEPVYAVRFTAAELF